MKKFLVLYQSPISASAQMANATPEQAKAGMAAWMGWMKQNEGALVDGGSPLGDVALVTRSGTTRGTSRITGYSIVQGDSIDDVSRRFAQHPHLHTPGDADIQILEFLSLPGMSG
ncbi:MAG TPA: hypothetical protein VN706_15765 [Gemmatimonadaceae bacterium]|nr:hypothetical protein [Gemmatimonadaceae bacterium]